MTDFYDGIHQIAREHIRGATIDGIKLGMNFTLDCMDKLAARLESELGDELGPLVREILEGAVDGMREGQDEYITRIAGSADD
ncbi:hypothetical protein [Mycolicibacterium houstonense]|uniref:hypothetical protein n=1 Tax=Mycolicibacterium houstonense TaxID=146021 RepID=UPI0008336C3C|nr:hypothetical protein [Mycolicibacterium houstonense]